MERTRRSWALARASWAVIAEHRELLRYPVIAGVVATILGILAIVMVGVGGFFATGGNRDAVNYVWYAGLFAFYVVTYTVVIFCNVALVTEVMHVFSGNAANRPTGWAMAKSELGNIVGYAAISATVGVAFRALSEKGGSVGRIVASIGGTAWSLATFLVVPVLVIEQVGPADALKRSATLLKRTWGEQIVGNGGIGLVSGLATVVVVALGAGLIWLAVQTSVTALVILAVALTLIALAIVAVIFSALGTVYSAAVYCYAIDQPAQDFGSPDLLATAYRRR